MRLGFGLGVGAAKAGGSDVGLAGVLSLHAETLVGRGFTLGGHGAIQLTDVEGAPAVVSLLAQAGYVELLRGWLQLVGGVGPAFSTDGDIGLGLLGAIQVRTPSVFGVQLRIDSALGPMNSILQSRHICAKVGFSERNP